MSSMQPEVFEAFRDLGVSEDKALKAATALAKRDDEVNDVMRDIAVIKWTMTFFFAVQLATFWMVFRLSTGM